MVPVQVFTERDTAAYANPCGISNHCLLLQGLFARSGGQTMVPFMFKKCLCFPVWRIRIRTDPYSGLYPLQGPTYGAVVSQNEQDPDPQQSEKSDPDLH